MTTGALHVFKSQIAAPPDRVFYELTRTDALQPCFANHRLVTRGLARGEPLQWRSRSGRHVLGQGQVLVYDAPQRFSFSFAYCRYDDAPFDAQVELQPEGDGTVLTLRLTNLPMNTATAADVIGDTRRMLAVLKRVAERGRPRLDTRAWLWWHERLERLQPQRCRAEHWPLQPRAGAGQADAQAPDRAGAAELEY